MVKEKVEATYFIGHWSRRGDLNTPSADYCSAALSLSYTGLMSDF